MAGTSLGLGQFGYDWIDEKPRSTTGRRRFRKANRQLKTRYMNRQLELEMKYLYQEEPVVEIDPADEAQEQLNYLLYLIG